MKKRISWSVITVSILVILKFTLISQVTSIHQGIITCNHYINMDDLIDISSSVIYLFPLLMLLMYVITVINGMIENRIYIITRLGAKKKYLNKIFILLIKEIGLVLLYFYIFEILVIILISGAITIDISTSIYSFIQYGTIICIFLLLFICCRLYQNYNLALTITILSILLTSITGLWAEFIGNKPLKEINFIVSNSVFSFGKTSTLAFMNYNGFIVLFSMVLILICIFYKKED